jgi:hypothetical protein
MSKIRRHHKKLKDKKREIEGKKRIARITKQTLFLLIALLSAIVIALMFRVGEVLWATWIIEYRIQIMSVAVFILIFLMLWSPVIIEVNRDPKTLSVPENTPYIS